MLTTIGISIILFLLLGGAPLYVGVFAVCVILFTQTQQLPLLSCVISFTKLQSQDFVSAIPLFTFSGYVLAKSQSPQRIVSAFQPLLQLNRGLDVLVVLLVMSLFTALTGASGVGILALGSLMYSMLKENGRSEQFCLGLITCSGSIGLLLAPSLPVIIYGLISSQNGTPQYAININHLFQKGILPTALLLASIILYAVFFESCTTKNEPFSWKSLKDNWSLAKWEIPIPILVYLGIYLGWVTVLEASVLSVFYVCLVVFVVHKDLQVKDLFPAVIESNKLSGSIFIIMTVAFSLTNYLVDQLIPQKVFEWITLYVREKYSFLALINIFLLLSGCVLDIFSAILILLPIVLPIAQLYGIDPYHFAIIFLVNLEIGYLTPPMGMNLFISSHRFGKDIIQIYKASLPFLLCMISVLLILTYVPQISSSGYSKNTLASKELQPVVLQNDVIHIFGSSEWESFEIRKSENISPQEEDFEFLEDVNFELIQTDATSSKIRILNPPTQGFLCIRKVKKSGEKSSISCLKINQQ